MADVPIQWSAYSQTKTAIFSSSALNNKADAATAISDALDNSGGDQYADIELLIDLATAATAGGYVALWFIRALDGTNYELSGDGTTIPARQADVIIPVVSTTTDSQKVTISRVVWPQGVFKVFFYNKTGQTTTNTNDLTQVYYRAYNDVVAA